MSQSSLKQDRPRVLIVGAGIGGLALGLLLERAGVPYSIFERAATIKPLGTKQTTKNFATSIAHTVFLTIFLTF